MKLLSTRRRCGDFLRKRWSTSICVLAVASIAFSLGGCIHTELPEQNISPAPVGTAKIPLKIAVLNDPSMVIHEPMGFYENLNPALANTVRDALANHFAEVAVVQNEGAVEDADLIATPSIQGPFSKSPLQLTVAFGKANKSIAELCSTEHYHADAPGADENLGADVGLSAATVVLPPLWLLMYPTIEHHDADRFNARFAPALVAMANDIAVQAANNPALKALANRPR